MALELRTRIGPAIITPTHDDAALMIPATKILTLRSRNHLDQNYELSSHRLILDGGVGAQQLEAENAVEDEQAVDVWFLTVTMVEKRYVDAEHLSDLLELRRADPADALLQCGTKNRAKDGGEKSLAIRSNQNSGLSNGYHADVLAIEFDRGSISKFLV